MKRLMFNLCLTAILILSAVSSASALTITGGATSTYIFDMLVNADGTMIDDGTIRINGRWTKTELKAILKDVTTDSLGFGNVAAYRIKDLPFYDGDPYANSVWMIYFDSSGYSVYVYRYKDSVEKEEE